MPKIKAKEKGTRGEREIVLTLGMVVTRVFERKGLAAPEIKRAERGCDIQGLADYAFEVKRDATPRIESDCLAWAQVEGYAKATGRIPVLFYRANNARWRVKIRSALLVPLSEIPFLNGPFRNGLFRPAPIVDISIDSFLEWFEADLEHRFESKLRLFERR